MMSCFRRDRYVPDIGELRYASRYAREDDPPYIEALNKQFCKPAIQEAQALDP